MKRCPKCSRTFPDENQKFCTFDGGLLRADQPAFDPNMTVAISRDPLETPTLETPVPAPPEPPEAKTSVRVGALNETIASFGTSTFQETGTPTSSDLTSPVPYSADSAPTSTDLSEFTPPPPPSATQNVPPPVPTPQPAPSAAPPPPPAAPATVPAASAPAATAAVAAPEPAKKKKSILPWILALLVVLFLLGSGAAVVGYFFVVKPMLEAKRQAITTISEPTNTNTNTKADTAPSPSDSSSPVDTSTPAETKKEPQPFTPPADAVQFTNSAENLDGELAAHYVEFSFYYPKGWIKDPKAGVQGASNYAKLDKLKDDKPDSLQERVLFNWYPSNGSYDADTDVFPASAKKLTDQLSKSLPNLEEVSHGETTVNSYKAYEVRFKGEAKNTVKGDFNYWGRVILLPPGSDTEKGRGVAIIILATSLADDVTSAADVGQKGGTALILNSF